MASAPSACQLHPCKMSKARSEPCRERPDRISYDPHESNARALTIFIRSSLCSSSPSSPNARHCVKALSSVKTIRFVARLCSTPATFCHEDSRHSACVALTTPTIPSTSTNPLSSSQNSIAKTSTGSLPALKQS